MEFNLAQIIGIIASAFIISAFLNKGDNHYKLLIMVGASLFALHFYMIGAMAGMVANIINAIRAGGSIYYHRSTPVLLFFLASYIAMGVVIYDSPVDLLPVFSGCVSTFAMFRLSGIQMRVCMYLSSLSWIAYGILVMSIGGIMTDSFILIANSITIYRLFKDKKYNAKKL
jgi:hypothetical protein